MSAKLQKIRFYAYFLALGLLSALWQLIMLRETLTSWRDNALFLNFFFIFWLIFTGLGSLFKTKN